MNEYERKAEPKHGERVKVTKDGAAVWCHSCKQWRLYSEAPCCPIPSKELMRYRKIESYQVGERVIIVDGADIGNEGEVKIVGDTWVLDQGEVVHVLIDGQEHSGAYVGMSLKRLS